MGIEVAMTWKGKTEEERMEGELLVTQVLREWAEGWTAIIPSMKRRDKC